MIGVRIVFAFWLGLTEAAGDVTTQVADDMAEVYDTGRALGRKLLGLP